MKVLAHRGASADAPENTLAAFAEAARQGADGVELDAMVCGSGEVVVCHDERLHRLAQRGWEVRRTPLAKLRTADVGTPLGFAAAFIPTLSEVLDSLPAHFLVNIELKCDVLDDGGLSEKVAQEIEHRGLAPRVVISSFNPACLFRVAAAAPALRRGVLIDPARSFWLQSMLGVPLLANHSVHLSLEQCTEARVARWRRYGLELAVWTVDSPEVALRLRDWGVRYCITNRPGALRAVLK